MCAGSHAVEVVIVIGKGGIGYDEAGDGAAVRKDVAGIGVGGGTFPGCVVKEVFGYGDIVKARVGEVDAVVYHGNVDAGAGQGVVAVDQADVGPGFGKAGEPVVFVAFQGGIGCVFGDQRGFFCVEAFQGDTARGRWCLCRTVQGPGSVTEQWGPGPVWGSVWAAGRPSRTGVLTGRE